MAEHDPRDRRGRRHQRRQEAAGFPAAPEAAPSSSHPSHPANANASVPVDLAPTPATVTQISTSSPSPTPAVNEASGTNVPSTVRVVVPAIVVIASVLIACVLSVQFYRWRKRRAASRKPILLPQIIVHSDFHTDALPYKLDVHLHDEPESGPTTFGKHGDLAKGRAPFDSATPIAVIFPSSESDTLDAKKGSIGIPQVPAPTARRQEGTRRLASNQFKDHRLSTRTSSLIASQLPSGSPLRMSAVAAALSDPTQSSPSQKKSVTVVATFQATMPDELPLIMGETLQIIEVYQDQWCLVERFGVGKKKRGVIPLCCVKAK